MALHPASSAAERTGIDTQGRPERAAMVLTLPWPCAGLFLGAFLGAFSKLENAKSFIHAGFWPIYE